MNVAKVICGEQSSMTFDEREVLELLLLELDLFERDMSAGPTPLLKSLFQDSVADRAATRAQIARPCGECQPFNLVSPAHRFDEIPCRHTFLEATEQSSREVSELPIGPGFDRIVKNWLKARVVDGGGTHH